MEGHQRTAQLSVLAAIVLVAVKLVTGLATGSLGLIAEALHSATDLVAAVLTLYAVRVAVRPPDREHPFGHGKAEHLAALGEAAALAVASVVLAALAATRLASGSGADIDAAWWAFAVLGFVIAVDAFRATASYRGAKRYNSPALASNALHFTGDLLGSVAVVVGLLFVRAGYQEGDAIAALIVAVLVIAAAVRLARNNVRVLMDQAPEAAAGAARDAIARDEPGVEVKRLRVREAAGAYFVDAVVGVRPDAAVGQGHALADAVEASVREALPRADVVVHVEPGEARDLRERINAAASGVLNVREIHNVRIVTVEGLHELSLHLKLPPSLPLDEAHAVATEMEVAIQAAAPEVSLIHTHIEPLSVERSGAEVEAGDERAIIIEVVRSLTGRAPEQLRMRAGERGRVVALLTVCVDAGQPLRDAHALASRIEEEIIRRAPAVVDVIVHTEPRE
ncbi:MAG: cation diffusion facilitator family transporter [Solirubrobacteraceae bacterium]